MIIKNACYTLFFLLFTSLLFAGTAATEIQAATKCEEMNINISYDYPQSGVVIGTPIRLGFEITGLKFNNIPNARLHLGHGSDFCNEFRTPGLNTTQLQSNDRATGDLTENIFPSDNVDEDHTCNVELQEITSSTIICEFANELPYPNTQVSIQLPPAVGQFQSFPIVGYANFTNSQVCMRVEDNCTWTSNSLNLGCATPSANGEFIINATQNLTPGSYQVIAGFGGACYEGEFGFAQLTVTAGAQNVPNQCGQSGNNCCYDGSKYTCTTGQPSSQTNSCFCSGLSGSGAGSLTVTELCSFVDPVAYPQGHQECLACIAGDKMFTPFGCIDIQPQKFIERILQITIGMAGGIAFIMIIYGGLMCMTSAGNPEKLNNCKEIVTSAIAGLFLVIFSAVILKIIGVDILGIPGFV